MNFRILLTLGFAFYLGAYFITVYIVGHGLGAELNPVQLLLFNAVGQGAVLVIGVAFYFASILVFEWFNTKFPSHGFVVLYPSIVFFGLSFIDFLNDLLIVLSYP
jgi:hypothetical protein